MKLYQSKTGYRYNSDSLVLYDFIATRGCKGRVLDVGCGCGVLALLLKRDFPESKMTALDIQETNATLTKENAQENGLVLDVFWQDFLHFIPADSFDLLVSNPPFYPAGAIQSKDSHLQQSRHSSYLPLEAFLHHAKRLLGPRGNLMFCYDANQLAHVLVSLANAKFTPLALRFVHAKKDKRASLVLIDAKRSSKSLCTVLPPFIMHENETYTQEAQAVFEKANTTSLSCA